MLMPSEGVKVGGDCRPVTYTYLSSLDA